jgi:hypothetical protein
VEGIERGHVHDDSIDDQQCPVNFGKKPVKDGRVFLNHIFTKSGCVIHEIENAKDVKQS